MGKQANEWASVFDPEFWNLIQIFLPKWTEPRDINENIER